MEIMPTSLEEKAAGWVSVTEVLDTFIPKNLLDWYLKTGKAEANRLSKAAMKIGSRLDELVCQDIAGAMKITSKDSLEVLNCVKAWQAFKQDYSPKITACQVEVTANKIKGHIDLVMDGRIVDIKCASSIKPNYWIQTAKYADMYTEEISGIAILRLDKNLGTYQFMTHEQAKVDINQCIKVFDGLLEAYRYYNPQRGTEELCQ